MIYTAFRFSVDAFHLSTGEKQDKKKTLQNFVSGSQLTKQQHESHNTHIFGMFYVVLNYLSYPDLFFKYRVSPYFKF